MNSTTPTMTRPARDLQGIGPARARSYTERGGATVRARMGLVVALLLLGGCQYLGMAGVVADQAVKTAMQINDAKAEVLVKSLCGISIGAYWRALNKLERRAVDDLCGGERAGG